MNDDISIKVNHISKIFQEQVGAKTFKETFINLGKKITGKKTGKKNRRFTALKDINFEVKKGEFFGIVGRNGCGKSTLLKTIAGIYTPTTGKVQINGQLTPFIELGVGFNPELTGRDNVFLNGALLGFTKSQMQEMYDDIVSFAELEDFMDVKLKNYSSGMQVRLAFSVAIRADSDILLIDEVLAVGDAIFQQKCFTYFEELKRRKKTVIFVSHDVGSLKKYCDRGILIEKSVIKSSGPIDDVVNDYLDIISEDESENIDSKSKLGNKRWGNQKVIIDSTKPYKKLYNDKDGFIKITVNYIAKKDVQSPVFGITIKNSSGVNVFDSNTLWAKVATKDMKNGDVAGIEWDIPNAFNTGDYEISPAVANKYGVEMYDWIDTASKFKIRKEKIATSVININHKIRLV